ncbi:hypothetical protein PJP10_05055 [Mycobacterium kansasii]|uniref:Uncharacterized protein n=1 Tax=Mycobacterium kansasii TaxID=1768 RepID=A0A1V3XED2_MYCKA|nr:hypothetical protein BZL30_5172 [Mycobacterium kansasii]OOK77583.1 hypothetical protein BZL29_3631 [Mycobacterium kansasii]
MTRDAAARSTRAFGLGTANALARERAQPSASPHIKHTSPSVENPRTAAR